MSSPRFTSMPFKDAVPIIEAFGRRLPIWNVPAKPEDRVIIDSLKYHTVHDHSESSAMSSGIRAILEQPIGHYQDIWMDCRKTIDEALSAAMKSPLTPLPKIYIHAEDDIIRLAGHTLIPMVEHALETICAKRVQDLGLPGGTHLELCSNHHGYGAQSRPDLVWFLVVPSTEMHPDGLRIAITILDYKRPMVIRDEDYEYALARSPGEFYGMIESSYQQPLQTLLKDNGFKLSQKCEKYSSYYSCPFISILDWNKLLVLQFPRTEDPRAPEDCFAELSKEQEELADECDVPRSDLVQGVVFDEKIDHSMSLPQMLVALIIEGFEAAISSLPLLHSPTANS